MIWMDIAPHMAKSARYTIGARVENKILDLLELTYIAYFADRNIKVDKIAECILMLDTTKLFISMAWEGKLISNKHYEVVGLKFDEIGKMLGGWKKSISNPEKKNRNI